MKNILLRSISAILCIVMAAAVLFSASAVVKTPGDINRDNEVNNKDVVTLFRHLSGDSSEIDETACDTNGDGDVDNKDVVALFRHVSDPDYEIFYGKDDGSDENTDEEPTEPGESEEDSESEEISEQEDSSEDIEEPVEYDNIFNVWDDSVKNTFSDLKNTDLSLTEQGIKLKYTASNSSGPRFTLNVAEYARIKNKRTLTGADASYIVIKLRSNTDGEFRVFGKLASSGSKTASYKPDNEFHYIIVDMTSTKVINEDYLSTMRLDWGAGKTPAGAEALITEIGFFSDLDDALDHCAVIAGTQSGIVRDGTPKKYLTMSFDDGTHQDLKILEILKKYDIDKATFFINTGICGADWSAGVSSMVGKNVEHIRFTMDELKTGIYDGYDVEVHTLSHPSLKAYDNNPSQIIKETKGDAINIFNLTGIYPTGLAWPGGDGDQTETTRRIVYEDTNLRFGRGITFKGNHYEIPTEFLLWQPTCSMSNRTCITYLNKFLKKECTEDMLFYGFSHGFEFDTYDSWDVFEEFIQKVSEAVKSGDVVLVTNAEFYQLFKDQIPAFVPAT